MYIWLKTKVWYIWDWLSISHSFPIKALFHSSISRNISFSFLICIGTESPSKRTRTLQLLVNTHLSFLMSLIHFLSSWPRLFVSCSVIMILESLSLDLFCQILSLYIPRENLTIILSGLALDPLRRCTPLSMSGV